MYDPESDLQQQPNESATLAQHIKAPAFLVLEERGHLLYSGECTAQLYTEYILFITQSGKTFRINYHEMISIITENYRIEIESIQPSRWILSKLGYLYEDFHRKLLALRNEILINDLLLQDKLHLTVPKCDFEYHDPLYQIHLQNQGAIRIYETKLVLITDNGPCVILPLALLKNISFPNLTILLETDSGETLQLRKLAQMYDPFKTGLLHAQNELSTRVTQWLSTLLPQTDSLSLYKLSQLLPEGRAASISEVQNIDSRFENALQNQIAASGRSTEFALLQKHAVSGQIYVGYKRGLWGDLTGDYLWFLFLLVNPVSGQPTNLMAMETLSTEGDSHQATFFFKVFDSPALSALNPSQFPYVFKEAVSQMNRSLLSINFRREPIYLEETKLRTTEYSKYYYATQLPALRHLRQLYIGRVIHHNPVQWEDDLQKLLQEMIDN